MREMKAPVVGSITAMSLPICAGLVAAAFGWYRVT